MDSEFESDESDRDLIPQHEEYFIAQSSKVKSTKTLSDIVDGFNLTQAEIRKEVESQPNKHREALKKRFEDEFFEKWFDLMDAGFNVLLHGVGSKLDLLDRFRQKWLLDQHHIVVFGFFPDLTIKHLINSLNEPIDGENTDEDQVIEDLREMDIDLFLLVHSMDRLLSGSEKIRQFLNKVMTKCAKVHVIASVDHVNSGLLWDTHQWSSCNWINFDVNTFDSYTIERAYSTANQSTFSSSLTNSLTLMSIEHVYESLTPNAQKIFLVILKFYINNPDEVVEGFSFTDCYLQCRDEFLVPSEMTLKTQLSEFKDHKLLRLQKGSDGGEVIVLGFDKSLAKKFVEKQEAEFLG